MSTAMILNTEDIKAVASGFLMKSDEVKRLVAGLIVEYPAAASAAMIAGQFAIEDAMTDVDKAFILKCVARKKVLIEGGNKPQDAAIFSVVAEAEAKQLLFGCAQYSVWSNGTLYVKEGGFRQWFRLRKDCSHLEVNPGVPEWRVLKDKSMWVIPGKASVAVAGEVVGIECVVGINGNASDIIANIEAKATRALLKRLWSKVSSIELDESEDQILEERGSVKEVKATRIESHNVQEILTPAEPLPFTTQIEQATGSRQLDVIARAVVAANLPEDETSFYKAMVTEARARLKEKLTT